jgi:hypothetical protein
VTLARLRERYGGDTPDEDLIVLSIVGDDDGVRDAARRSIVSLNAASR